MKREIAEDIKERWGSEVLQEVYEEPMWRSGLRARECVASTRRHQITQEKDMGTAVKRLARMGRPRS
jgi:hypothetical protein